MFQAVLNKKTNPLVVLTLIFLCGCVSKQNTIVLDYSDFGPQVMSYETIGFDWYEWNAHGSKEKANIKIVVYKDKKSVAINKYKDSQNPPAIDYRLISQYTALEFLNKNIQQLSETSEFPKILKQLEQTKIKIVAALK